WRSRGARVYFVSVNPVNDSKTKYVKNAQIESYNRSVRSSLSSNVTYVDTYSSLYYQIAFDDSMTDSEGLHYYSATYKSIYQMLPSGTRYSYSY
ncbi:MAG: hypothetical protein IJ133_02150, partial [Clostridia bacterium]|nr:hypothetical protein [Clostridia bacterium]